MCLHTFDVLRGIVNKHGVAWMEGITARMVKCTEGVGAAALEMDKFGEEEHTTRHVHCSTVTCFR
jgi:hypothetical protein